jgi:hypothetical protein
MFARPFLLLAAFVAAPAAADTIVVRAGGLASQPRETFRQGAVDSDEYDSFAIVRGQIAP